MEQLEARRLMAGDLSTWTREAGVPVSHLAILGSAAALTDDARENNDTFASANNLGTLTAATTVSNLVMADANDWYKFTMTGAGGTSDSVAIGFDHARGDLDLELYNAQGTRLQASQTVTNNEQVSLRGLAAGTYYVRVYGYRGVSNPRYTLTIQPGRPLVDDRFENNDTLATARGLGTLSAPQTYRDLAMADTHDWYSFRMSAAGQSTDHVTIQFQHPQGDLDLELTNAQGQRLGLAATTANSERISLSGLAAGTYYVHVYGYRGAFNPNYSLVIDPGEVTAPATPTPSPFDIQLVFSNLSTSMQGIFEQAAQRWESVIVGDLPDVNLYGQLIDDLVIDARGVSIDGAGGVLGQAAPTYVRTSTLLPVRGFMEFDTADLNAMLANGSLLDVIVHEMGHVLGIGTIWAQRGLVSGAGTSNPRFIGPQATAAYNLLFGRNETGVPLETGGGAGTQDSHWSESLFGNEVMTGFVGPGYSLPMSTVTIASLADLGYSVNLAAADAYSPPGLTASIIAAPLPSRTAALRAPTLEATVIGAYRAAPAAGVAPPAAGLRDLPVSVGLAASRSRQAAEARGPQRGAWEQAVDSVYERLAPLPEALEGFRPGGLPRSTRLAADFFAV